MRKNRKVRARIIELFGSQWQFAQALGIHESLVSHVLRGKRELGEEDREESARLLQWPSSFLVEHLPTNR